MYERFTHHARNCLEIARQQSRLRGCECVDSQHLLLGMMHQGGAAASVLEELGVDLAMVEQLIDRLVQPKSVSLTTEFRPPQTVQTKKAIEYALEEARKLHHTYVGTEHLLLGILRIPESVATSVLQSFGLDLAAVRERTVERTIQGREGGDVEGGELPGK